MIAQKSIEAEELSNQWIACLRPADFTSFAMKVVTKRN